MGGERLPEPNQAEWPGPWGGEGSPVPIHLVLILAPGHCSHRGICTSGSPCLTFEETEAQGSQITGAPQLCGGASGGTLTPTELEAQAPPMTILGPSPTGPIPPGHALVLDPTHPREWLWPLSRCQAWKRDRDTETARWLMALRRPLPSWCRASLWPIQNIPGCCFHCLCPPHRILLASRVQLRPLPHSGKTPKASSHGCLPFSWPQGGGP